jgi:hypothetical protein
MHPALAAVLLAAAGCSARPNDAAPTAPPPPPKQYGDGTAGLKALWTDILDDARHDDREKVHDLMASMTMTSDDLVALFGPERAAWFAPRYAPMIARLTNIGAMELVAQIADRKYDDIAVFPVDERSPEPADRAILAAMRAKLPMYGVRVKRKTESLGLRYDFFVYRGGRWVTGNQLGKLLVADATPAAAPHAAAAPCCDGGARPR